MTARRIQLSIILTCCGLLAWPMGASSQEKEKEKQPEVAKPEKVRFNSVDGVELHGKFYPSSGMKKPVVLLLHALGEESGTKSWTSLAEELQKEGNNVLTFDFRGHGNSVNLADAEKFWANQHNLNLAGGKGGANKSSIEFKNFNKAYYPALVNDIAAARAYLERTRNDEKICSTSSIIVVGAETGGTLGAIWMTSEWFRFKLNPSVLPGMQPQLDSRPEGKDIIGAVFLSLSPKLGDRKVNVNSLVRVPGIKGNTHMLFMYGDDDTIGKEVARSCQTFLKKDNKSRPAAAYPLKGSKLTGAGLLQKSLDTEKVIVAAVSEMVDAKSNEWTEKEFKKTEYFWRIPAGVGLPDTIIQLKPVGDTNLNYDTYDKFVP